MKHEQKEVGCPRVGCEHTITRTQSFTSTCDGERLFWPVRHKEVNVTTPQPPLFQPYAGNNIELHQNCNYDHECIQGAECVVNNTVKANEKRCYCRFGYEEEDNACNSKCLLVDPYMI
ncbi:hypothetical protein J6590_014400 [Homalodisca vitripennis]|nr:hypothetical protein J6590_014400 [Homalodisca vitripennis]